MKVIWTYAEKPSRETQVPKARTIGTVLITDLGQCTYPACPMTPDPTRVRCRTMYGAPHAAVLHLSATGQS